VSATVIESVLLIGEFFYTLTHGHPWIAVLMGIGIVVTGQGRWLLRLFVVVLLVCILHDAWTGQLWSEIHANR
jgi:hypothetical protein